MASRPGDVPGTNVFRPAVEGGGCVTQVSCTAKNSDTSNIVIALPVRKGSIAMNQATNRSSQEAERPPVAGPRLGALGKTTALALFGMGLIYLFQFLLVWLVRGVVVLPLLAPALLALLGVVLVMARVHWAPGLGALVALAPFVTTLAIPLASSTLLHPTSNLAFFGILLVQFACALIALVGGAAAAIQNAQGREQPSLRWLSPFLSGVLGLVLGMLLLAGITSANPPSTVTSPTNGMPTVHIAGNNFLTNVVLVPKGESLLLVEDDSVEHIIQNGTWTPSGLPQPQTEQGAPVVHSLDLKGGSLHIGPFPIAGVFHLYCTIHQDMSLTVVVQ